jgi:hypothetical protein
MSRRARLGTSGRVLMDNTGLYRLVHRAHVSPAGCLGLYGILRDDGRFPFLAKRFDRGLYPTVAGRQARCFAGGLDGGFRVSHGISKIKIVI